MKIKADLLRVKTGPYNHNGERVEPEQQGVQRVLVTEFDANMKGGNKVGSIQGEVIYNTSAGEVAQAMRSPCFSCAHFNRRAWAKLFAYWNDPASPIDARRNLNGVRASLLQSGNSTIGEKSPGQDGEMDVEHALGLLGVCEPLSEMNRDPVIVYPNGHCPDEVCTPQQPNGLYKPRSADAERMGSQVFDNVMRLAQGKQG